MNRLAGKEMPIFVRDRFSQLAFKDGNDSATRDLDPAKFKCRDGRRHDEEYHELGLVPEGGGLIPNQATVPELPDTMRARPVF